MVENIDPSTITFENLRLRYRGGKSSSKGSGRNKEHYYIHYAVTDVGDIEMDRWCQLAKELIARHHEEGLQSQLLEWDTEHNYTNANAKALEEESLELHLSRIFDDPLWVCFVPFNQRYRPEVLESTPLVWVKTECCEKPGLTTQALVDHARGGEGGRTTSCPCCGRWAKFEVIDAPTEDSGMVTQMEM